MIKVHMVKIGKLFFACIFFLLLTLMILSKAAVTLEVRSVDGIPIRNIAVGCECTIRATVQVSDVGKHEQIPECVLEDKDQQFELLGSTQSRGIFVLNGVKKNVSTVAWQAKARKLGNACLKALVGNEQSNEYNIPVTEPLITSVTVPSCELVLDKTEIVVGETQAFVVRMYTNKPYNAELCMTHVLPDALKITNLEGPHYSLTRQGAADISLLEWHGDITAQKEGIYSLPKFLIQYNKPTGFFSLFGYTQPKKLATSPVQLVVRSAPVGPGGTSVHFVGKLVRFTSNLEKSSIVQGQATTFTLTFEGTGNTDALSVPELCLPQELSYYTPHCTREQLKEGHIRVTWHYVLQAHTPGSILVPAQEFTWFDTQERTCKQIRTNQYTLTVTPAHDITSNTPDTECAQAQEQKKMQHDELDSSIAHILALERVQPALAWQQLYLLLCLPFGVWLLSAGALMITSGQGRRLYYYYTAYLRARRALRQAQEKQYVWLIYTIFRCYIGDRRKLDQTSTLTHEYLCSCMRAQLTQEEYHQWFLFLQDSLYVSGYAPRTTCDTRQEHAIHYLFIRAYKWLIKLRAYT